MSSPTQSAVEDGLGPGSSSVHGVKRTKTTSEPGSHALCSDATDQAAASGSKKRRRNTVPAEIEINVNLPEPASKKTARRAKKAKSIHNASQIKQATTTPVEPAIEQTSDKKQASKRSEHSVWIGNLPWSITKETLRDFLVEQTGLKSETITRIHLPMAGRHTNTKLAAKSLNRGFAYVDFSSKLAMNSVLALTETKMHHRPLLIKDAKNFQGRPENMQTKKEQGNALGDKRADIKSQFANNRVFVGNLSFHVTKADLETYYSQYGLVKHIHVATFEDSGKCKGYAWVTFDSVADATSAVQGFISQDESRRGGKKDGSKKEKDLTARNRLISDHGQSKLFGKELRCEFAEDSTVRYNKRFGKNGQCMAAEGGNPSTWEGEDMKKEKSRYSNADGVYT